MSMKSKFLFGALLGSIALASCTADEELNSPAVSQESPIKFAVSLEGSDGMPILTRADMTSDFGLNFEAGDLMSLFHGIADVSSSLTGYQNAIYEGSAKDGEAFVFTTKSMVLEKGAIMVYPADTAFTNSGSAAPVITIPENQDARTKELTPYMSELLTIGSYNEPSTENTAGYGKKYDIILKRVGTTLILTTVPSNTDKIDGLGVSPLKVSSIEMNASDAFTTSISVKYNADTPYRNSEFSLWTKVSDVDVDNATVANALTTTDITDNYNAVFTLLPAKTGTIISSANVVIKTNYGKVTLEDVKGDIWGKTATTVTYDKTVTEGIQEVLNNTWTNATTGSFIGEKIGKFGKRSIQADMSTLDMDGLHITDQQHLIDALKVYDAIANDATVNFFLDGDENGEFVMDAEATAAYEARVADAENKITFKLSTDPATQCDAVKFVSTTETEVPTALKFGTATPVKFAGLWKYSDSKTFDYIASLEVVEGATMTMTNMITATATNPATTAITNNGTVNISGATTLKLNMTNNGVIDIPVGAEFLMNGAELTNNATSLEVYGKIDNAGSLGVQSNTSGKINNYGYITQKNADAYTYVSTNASTGKTFADAFAADAKIGTIELFGTGNVNTVVASTGLPGFIKVITNVTSVTQAEVGEYANYVEITGACTACGTLPTTVKYVEVKSSARVVWTTAAFTLTGLIVDDGYSLNIPRGSVVTATTTYLKGRIYNAGTFNCTDFDGYLGGASTDANNVIVGG